MEMYGLRHIGCAILSLSFSSCAIPRAAIRDDGVVLVDVIGSGMFRVGGRSFLADDLAFALRHMRTPAANSVEVRIPLQWLGEDNGERCGRLLQKVAGDPDSRVHWRFFAWTPGDLSTLREVQCNVYTLAMAFASSPEIAVRGAAV